MRLLALAVLAASSLHGESGADGWLRYPRMEAPFRWPAVVVELDNDPLAGTARDEIARAFRSMYGRTMRFSPGLPDEDAIVLRRLEDPAAIPGSYRLASADRHGHRDMIVEGADGRGILYGTFQLLSGLAMGKTSLALESAPKAAIRWVNQWDNLDGSIERGYAGRSIFFADGAVRSDLSRASAYARLLASVGINGCTVNNVNADLQILSSDRLAQIGRIADAFRPWGVRLSLSVDLSSPQTVGHLDTFDPLDRQIAAWWQKKVDEVYQLVPDFGGFVVKADSEGRAGPSKYGRTPADAANVLARALKPHGGIVLYRGFVYNHHLDWRDPKADRARAGYDNFRYLDGKFENNVIVQIKHGPIDFQVREPVSPLFDGLPHTRKAIELQITQEYTGQQRHMVFLPAMWKQALDFDLRINNRNAPVSSLLDGYVGVANVGLDANWLAHPMAMANLYGFGRLAWNSNTSLSQIASDWTRLTFGNNPKVVKTVTNMQLSSWRIYEDYTGPLGVGTLTDIIHVHYGPGIESSERNGWGQWHRADHDGIGMDRTVKTGTGYAGQYPPPVAAEYESLASTPDELLLFFHHVPYAYRLHSGTTVIQHVYDSHYKGAQEAAGLRSQWESLRGLVDQERFDKTLHLLRYQEGHAIEWRDAVCQWFLKTSGIADAKGRAGHYPGRIEAESMQLEGYKVTGVTPWETASEGKAVTCDRADGCHASTVFDGPSGWYTIAAQYFDQNNGTAEYRMTLNGQPIAGWKADRDLPSTKMDGHTAIRFVLPAVPLRPHDVLSIVGTKDGGEPASLDYLELTKNHSAAMTSR